LTETPQDNAAAQHAEEIAHRISHLVTNSQKVWAESLDHISEDINTAISDPLHAWPAITHFAQDMFDHPLKIAEATLDYWTQQADLWARIIRRSMGEEDAQPLATPAQGDRRFQDSIWDENPFFDYLKQSYLLTGNWLKQRLEEAGGLTDKERRKLEFLTRSYIEAISPTNFPWSNPEVLKTTIEEGGENLLRGLDNLMRDMERGHGHLLIRQTDMDAFEVGRDMANTPGKVIYQNDLMQLIQYTPTTDEVYERPVVIVSPWINKYYILDLNEKKSFIRWLVGQGHTVFVVSWVNATEAQRNEGWKDYMRRGPLTAIEKVTEETGANKVNLIGYCIGGTMAATTLAYKAVTGGTRVGSATFFTTQLDFTDAGDLQIFVDDHVIHNLESQMEEQGILAAENMQGAFNSLRSTDLIWGFVINNYLLGRENFPFDLLYWNSDSTRMPGKLHVRYLDEFYNKNSLAKGRFDVEGAVLDARNIKVPVYHVAAIEDHIAPAASAYRAAKLIGSRSQRFVLAGSGHIAGVINPPAMKKYQYWTKAGVKEATLDEWRESAVETPGSWWPDYHEWLVKQSKNKKVPAREPGKVLGTLEDAPGSYVKVRFDKD